MYICDIFLRSPELEGSSAPTPYLTPRSLFDQSIFLGAAAVVFLLFYLFIYGFMYFSISYSLSIIFIDGSLFIWEKFI